MARLSAAMTMPGVECWPHRRRPATDGVDGDKGGEGEEGDRDDPQGQVLAPFRILGGELPGQGDGGGHLDHRVQAEADQRGGVRDAAGPERDDGLDHVVADGRGDEAAGSAGSGRRGGPARHQPERRHARHVPSGAQQAGSTARTTPSRSPMACPSRASASSYRIRRPSGTATTRPQPRRQVRWLDRLCRETPRESARSAG